MSESTYELQETIHGVTFTYRTRGEDPLVMEGFGRTNRGGDYEDMLLSAVGDDHAMPIVDARPISFDVVSILAYQGKGQFQRYAINTATQTWTREGGAGRSAVRPVADLRVRIDQEGESDHAAAQIEVAGTRGEYVALIHDGSTCRVVWNPATRRYVQVCS